MFYFFIVLPMLTEFHSHKITEAVMLQPPYPQIKIAKNSAFYKISKLLKSVQVENSHLFLPRVTIQEGTTLHILC